MLGTSVNILPRFENQFPGAGSTRVSLICHQFRIAFALVSRDRNSCEIQTTKHRLQLQKSNSDQKSSNYKLRQRELVAAGMHCAHHPGEKRTSK